MARNCGHTARARAGWRLPALGEGRFPHRARCAVHADAGVCRGPLTHPSGSPPAVTLAKFTARPDLSLVATAADVLENIGKRELQVVDARSAGRFRGDEPEPRPGVRRGHVPGALSVPFSSLLDAEGRMLPNDQLRKVLSARWCRSHLPHLRHLSFALAAASTWTASP
jgi:3-mercaptopyruvate sulfurtransferase SseA